MGRTAIFSVETTAGLQRVGLYFESIIIIIIIIFIIIIIILTFTQCIYNYVPETNHVPTLYTVAAILLLQYTAYVTLSSSINPLYCTSALPAVCVQCPVCLFCLVPGHRAFPIRCSGIVRGILCGFS